MTDAEHIALKALLATAPYAALSHGEAVSKLGDPSGVKVSRGDISRQQAIELLAPVVAGLLQRAADPDPGIAGWAKYWLGVYDRLVAPIATVHTGVDFVVTLAAQLRENGFMTQVQHDAFLLVELTNWQAERGNPDAITPTEGDVNNARNGEFK